MSKSIGLKKISDIIASNQNLAAVLVPRRTAMALIDEMYPNLDRSGFDGEDEDLFDSVRHNTRDKYIRLVTQGGYIGTILSVPMVVADDVVICPLTEQELIDSAVRFGVDMAEFNTERRRKKIA